MLKSQHTIDVQQAHIQATSSLKNHFAAANMLDSRFSIEEFEAADIAHTKALEDFWKEPTPIVDLEG